MDDVNLVSEEELKLIEKTGGKVRSKNKAEKESKVEKDNKNKVEKVEKDNKPTVEEKDLVQALTNKVKHPNETAREQLKKALPFSKIFEWILSSYSAQVPKIKLVNNAGQSIPFNIDYNEGMIRRALALSTVKNMILDNSMTASIVMFKIHDGKTRKECNYATLFCNDATKFSDKALSMMFQYDPPKFGTTLLFYISTAPSLISCDGEYRSRFIRYTDFLRAKTAFPNLWDELDSYVSKIRVKRDWSIYAGYYTPQSDHYKAINTDLEQVVRNELLPNTLLIMSWFQAIYNEMIGLTETHINPIYKEILLDNYEEDSEYLKALIKKYSAEDMERFKVAISTIIHPIFGSDKKRYVPFGFKMIPLNISEVQRPFDMKFKPWREYFISNKCSDLVCNQIAPGFSVMGPYYYIRNSKKGLYDNKSQYERMKNSELARDILRALYEAQRGTYFASAGSKAVSKTSEQIRQWISAKFRKLSMAINEPINYAIEEIIVSDVTFIMSSEHVGRTVADTITLIQENKALDINLGKPLIDAGYDYFAKYIFEICYGLLTLNKRIGAIHGDFHLNNATIGYLYPNTVSDAKVVYYVTDDMPFIFPNNGYFSCVIDFSRSLVDLDRYESLADPSLPSTHKLVKDTDKFIHNEINSLLALYLTLFPSKAIRKEELQILFKKYYPAVFKLLTCIDVYMFTIRLGRLIRQIKEPAGKKATDLIDKINRMSEVYIATDMNNLLNDPEVQSAKILAAPYPIETIIKKCFLEYVNGAAYKKIGTVTDCYNINNPMKYSLSRYDTFPECVQTSKYLDDKGVLVDVKEITKLRSEGRYAYEKSIKENYETMVFLGNQYEESLGWESKETRV